MVVHLLKDKLYFKEEDIEIFLSLGGFWVLLIDKIKRKILNIFLIKLQYFKEAKLERDKNEKMYKNLGILTGITIL